MQKKILAVAVAGLMSGAAFAQSNVTVYGVVDAMFGQNKASAATGTTLKQTVVSDSQQAGSRIGFRGTEDLGNGLKAIFTLEYGINSEEAAGLVGDARQQFVGLTGGFGTFVAGRLYSPGYNISSKFNVGVGGGSLSALAALQNGAGASINMGGAGRLNNGMAYVSPNYSGLVATVAYTTLGENNRGATDRVWGLGLDYDNGPVAVSFAHHNLATNTAAVTANSTLTLATVGNCGANTTVVGQISNNAGPVTLDVCGNNLAAAFTTKTKENILAGSYDFGVAKVALSYQNRKANNGTTTTADNRVWNVGGIVPVMGNGSVRINYASLNDKTATNADAKAWSLGYVHTMSKRTSLYTGYNRVKNNNAGTVSTAGGLAPTQASGKSTSYGIGMTHSF